MNRKRQSIGDFPHLAARPRAVAKVFLHQVVDAPPVVGLKADRSFHY